MGSIFNYIWISPFPNAPPISTIFIVEIGITLLITSLQHLIYISSTWIYVFLFYIFIYSMNWWLIGLHQLSPQEIMVFSAKSFSKKGPISHIC
jgi:hypothetical protein